jgi:PEP-CTERM motif
MTRFGRGSGIILAVAALTTLPASAHAADAYWNQLCTNGGWTFNTCASAWVTTSGNTVTIRVWNLGGAPGSNTFNNAGFTAVGLSNIGSGLIFGNLVAKRVNGTSYAGWSFATGGGGIPGPSAASGVSINGIGSAIFSQYATNIPGNGSPAVTNWGGSGQFGSGYVTFMFNVYQQVCTGTGKKKVCNNTPYTVDLSNAVLGLHVQSGPNGQSTGYECAAGGTAGGGLQNPCSGISTVPEPTTMITMGTGLVGLSLVGWRRRRQAA